MPYLIIIANCYNIYTFSKKLNNNNHHHHYCSSSGSNGQSRFFFSKYLNEGINGNYKN